MSGGQTCTLCELPVSRAAVSNATGNPFCCVGCRGVYDVLGDEQPGDFDTPGDSIDESASPPEEPPEGHETTFLRVDGMHCATCETFIEYQAGTRDGVSTVDASYITDTVRIDHDPSVVDESALRDALTGYGYRAYAKDDPLGRRQSQDRMLFRLIVGVVFGMTIMLNYVAVIYPTYFSHGLYYPPEVAEFLSEMLASTSAAYFYLVLGILTSVVLFVTGGPILKGAIVSIRTRQPNMDLLVALAATSAWAYSTVAIFAGHPHIYYDVTVGIIVVVTAGSYYESEIKRKATDRLADLTVTQVDEARLYSPDTGNNEVIDVATLEGGETVLVREGERIPVDGSVADGTATVDEAVVTGESLPESKGTGDQVVGGSLVRDGSLVVEVGPGGDSSIDRITDMVWNLQSGNHGIQQLADKLATIFVPLVLILAVVVATMHFALGASITATILVALTVLIVSCPCALGLATPLAIATSVRAALERGIVVFDETIFERLRDVDVVIFDKTGTLTTGEMTVQRVLDADGSEVNDPDFRQPDLNMSADGLPALLERVALLESHSSHPIADAIVEAFGPENGAENSPSRESSESAAADGGITTDQASDNADGPIANGTSTDETSAGGTTANRTTAGDSNAEPTRVNDVESHTTGISGRVDGLRILVGNRQLYEKQGWTVPRPLADAADSLQADGQVPVLVGHSGAAAGLIAVGDDPRPGWDELVESLSDRGVEIAVLSGDDERAAAEFGTHPGVDHVFAGVPPEAKAETVRRLGAGRRTVMVGDGTNDAPALASADLGIALGSGTALAADAADVAIVTDELASIETVFDLAGAANSRVKQNIGWAFCYNGIAIPLAIVGLINPLFAAVAMATSSLLVVTNSSRTLLSD